MAIARTFLDWHLPLLPQVVDNLVQRYARDGELSLSSVVLVFSGHRAARRFLELLLQRAGAEYPALIPPRTVTFHQLPEMLYRQKRALADDLTQLLVWREAVQAIPPGELSVALPHLPEPEALTAWMSLCRTLRDQNDELVADFVEYDRIVQLLNEQGLTSEQRRWEQLRRIHAEYLQQMDALELWDRQEARLVAIEQREVEADFDIVLVGTVDMNRMVREMLRQIADRVTALIHAPESEAALFDEFGCVVPAAWDQRKLNLPLTSCRIVETPQAQASEAVRQLRQRQSQVAPDDVTIGIADDALVPVIVQELADAGIVGRWPVGMQVRESRPWRLLYAVAAHLASARDQQPPRFATLLDLVRHPDVSEFINRTLQPTQSGTPPDDWLTTLDWYVAETLQVCPGEVLVDGPRADQVRGVLVAVDRMLSALEESPRSDGAVAARRQRPSASRSAARQGRRPDAEMDAARRIVKPSRMLSRQSLRAWAEGAWRLLALVYGDRELTDSAADRGLAAAVNGWRRLTERLRQIPAAVAPDCMAAPAIQFLLSEIADDVVAAEECETAIELLGWLELAHDDAPVLICTGFNEGHVPESMTSDVFLPNSLREKLGITDNARRYARDACALSAILHSRQDVVLISGRVDAQGNPLLPSRLFFAAEVESLPERVAAFYERGEAADRTDDEGDSRDLPRESTGLRGAVDRSRFVIPEPPDDLPPPVEIPVTAFRDVLHCPYRAFLKRELRLRSVDDDVLELSAASFGSLLHAVLNRFAESDLRHALAENDIRDFLREELHSLARARFGSYRSATVNVQLSMAESRLDAFARWQAESAREGWRIWCAERESRCDGFRDARDRPVTLTGRIDRIDHFPDRSEWRVLDYKTSERAETPEKAHRTSQGEWTDLQLPLYRLLARALGLKGSIQLGYVHLPSDVNSVDCTLAEWSEDDLLSAEAEARRIAADIIDLKIDHIAPGDDFRFSEFARVCQDTVVNPEIPWRATWKGRRSVR